MKISDILHIPAFGKARLIAGHKGNEREVFSVNMMDAPDIIHYLKPNELLVTTAYHLKDNPHDLLELIKNMNEQQCAGLAIKTKRFLEEIPENALAYANEIGFPIIELPIDISLGEVVNQSLSYILDKRTNELLFAIKTHQKFTNHIMSGKGLTSLLENLSSMIKYPIILLDKHFRIIASSHPFSKISGKLSKLYTNGFRLFLPNTSHSCFSIISNQEVVSVFPIYTHEKNSGCLAVIGFIPFSNPSIILAIEQAANVISFELMKENALKQYTKKVRNEFFINFIEGAFQSEEEIAIKAKEFLIINDQSYICAIGKLDENNPSLSFTEFHKEIDIIFEFIEEESYIFSKSIHHFTKGNICILLFPLIESWADLNSIILPFLQELQLKIKNRYNLTVSFGISNLCQQFIDVQKGFKEALEALQTGRLSGKRQFIQFYRRKDIAELLKMIPIQDLEDFYNQTLQKLSGQSVNEKQILLHTLFVFLESHCQISETAKKLFVHRNTVIYRLEKCEELIGKSLKDPDTTFRLRLAFRIKELLHL
ncbi:transcriptional regulator of the purine degradation operon [Bacillus methanolicus PB1]|uniref:Transcriptional regulator of the purine degradation operon n=1 Tax=Bacillus methanolicus PB1 TaxID=997296 RepID=I3E1R1_BACMT|nr:PucR family transcriptional regulator [Bacillus methanolicus]EIJ80432.1 transcriptional regulator of the purine degradation operon [Bacillus methanolicus PB1]